VLVRFYVTWSVILVSKCVKSKRRRRRKKIMIMENKKIRGNLTAAAAYSQELRFGE